MIFDQFNIPSGPVLGVHLGAVIVERHGPMVLRICQSALHDSHDAEDAFQATFLVLLHRSRMIRKWQSLGPWLHGVALRVAACCAKDYGSPPGTRAPLGRAAASGTGRGCGRSSRSRSRSRDPRRDRTSARAFSRLHRALRCGGTLPRRCCAELRLATRDRQEPRLNRGRRLLRDRLLRRGLAPALVGAALSGLNSSVRAAGSEGLFEATVRVALLTATAQINIKTGAASAAVTVLVHRVARGLLMRKLKTALVNLMILGLITVGAGAIVVHSPLGAGSQPPTETPPELKAPQPSPAISDAKTKVAIRRPPRNDGTSLVPITVTGQAKDEAGKPIAGAIIYVMNANNGRNIDDPVVLATARSGADGRFAIQGMELPVLKPGPGSLSAFEEGFFQVAGTAKASASRGTRSAAFARAHAPRPRTMPTLTAVASSTRRNRSGSTWCSACLQLFHGRVIDDHRKPLAGVPVQVGYCDDPRTPGGYGMSTVFALIRPGVRSRLERSFNGIGSLPEAIRSTRTGPDGSYRIEGLPARLSS